MKRWRRDWRYRGGGSETELPLSGAEPRGWRVQRHTRSRVCRLYSPPKSRLRNWLKPIQTEPKIVLGELARRASPRPHPPPSTMHAHATATAMTDIRGDLDRSMRVVRTLLDTTRNPQLPANVPHAYADKYHLVETAARGAISAQLRALGLLGLGAREIGVLQTRGKDRTTTLAFEVEQRCTFVSTSTRTVEDATKTVVEKTGGYFGGGTATLSSSQRVIEHRWKVRKGCRGRGAGMGAAVRVICEESEKDSGVRAWRASSKSSLRLTLLYPSCTTLLPPYCAPSLVPPSWSLSFPPSAAPLLCPFFCSPSYSLSSSHTLSSVSHYSPITPIS